MADGAAEIAGVERDTMLAEVERQRGKQSWKQKKQLERRAMTPALESQPKERQLHYDDVRSAKAEEGIVQLVVLDPALFEQIHGLEPEDFSVPWLGRVYKEACRQWKETGAVNMTVLAQTLTAAEMSLLTGYPAKAPGCGKRRTGELWLQQF